MGDRKKASYEFTHCPFCSAPLQINEKIIFKVKNCPVCNSPITFEEFFDEEKEDVGYQIKADIKGETFDIDGFKVEDGRLTFYDGAGGEIYIPDQVISIGKGVFKNNTTIKKLVFPSSVLHIEEEAFARCEELILVQFNEQLKTIANSAFSFCRRIKEFTLPQNLIAMGYEVFHGCDNLLYADLPMNIKWIAGSPYRYCRNLKRATVPNCVVNLLVWFSETENIEVYNFGKSVNLIQFLPLKKALEIHFEDPSGWEYGQVSFFYDKSLHSVDENILKNPKTACNFIKKLVKNRHYLQKPSISENYGCYKIDE